jgi:DsbC/DsbD-like thiol-disulfide interchange protein
MMLPALCSVVLALAVVAQSSTPAVKASSVETRHLAAATSLSAATVAPGGRLHVYIDVVPKPRMHVYAPEERAYQAVSLTLAPAAGLIIGKPLFPKGERFFFAPLSETQMVFSKPFRIEIPVTVNRSSKPGPRDLTGTLEYQACDDTVCYIPTTTVLTWSVTIR